MKELEIKSESELMQLAFSLGKPITSRVNSPIIDNLIAVDKQNAHKQSLSAKFGVDKFPFHTDGAYFSPPPKYIILRYIKGAENPTPTILCDLQDMGNSSKLICKNSIWKVNSRSGTFYSSILSHDEQFFRYDRCIMKPINSNEIFDNKFEKIINDLPKILISWDINKTLVINNWNCLHARPMVKEEEVNYRTLQRIMVL